MKTLIMVILAMWMLVAGLAYPETGPDFPVLTGPYLGQELPGTTPSVFAPGLISSKEYVEVGCSFSPDGREFYFARSLEDRGVIYVMKYSAGKWTAPEKMDLSTARYQSEPHISHQGNQMFFTEFHPGSEPSGKPKVTISMAEKLKNGWSSPKTLWDGMYATTAKNGNIYYTNNEERTIYRRIYNNEEYSRPEPVLIENRSFPTSHPCISPDESFIIYGGFDPHGQSKGEWADLFVSFKKHDESFGEAINLGNSINNQYPNICPMLSPDGGYLFYCNRGDIYWVSTKIIHGIKSINETEKK